MKILYFFISISISIVSIGCNASSQRENKPHTENVARPAQNNRDNQDLSGIYKQESPLCTTTYGNGKCTEDVVDCLSIQPSDNHSYRVNLYSVQANEHICSFSLNMIKNNDGLSYFNSRDGKLNLIVVGDHFEFSSENLDLTDPSIGYCGAQAGLEYIRVPLILRSNGSQECPAP